MRITKKELIFVFSFVFYIIIFSSLVNAEILSGMVLSQPTNVSIFILPPKPILEIISPINGTYLTNVSLLLNFTSTPADNYWYNLNNGANKTTYLPGEYFDVGGDGVYTLYLYANKSGAIGSANVTFKVNLTLFKILYDEYKGIFKGDSTNFYAYTYEQMLNMSNIVLENVLYGKIYYKDNISLPYDDDFYDYTLDLDNKTNISFNRIEINASGLPNFDIPATIWFYGISFTNPRVMRDGSACYSCMIEDYSGGVLRVRVPGAGLYTIEEMAAPIIVGRARAGYAEIPCLTRWICTDWSKCKDGKQNRTCWEENELCEAEGPKPAEEMECEEKIPLIEIEYPIAKECCIIGICWFKFIICWYWWVLIALAIAIWIVYRRIRRILLGRKGRELRVRIIYQRTPVYSEHEYLAFAARKSKLKEQLKKLDREFKRGTIEKRGYILTRNKIVKEIDEINRKAKGD
ncbi:MAG: hypothetical protein QXS38_01345 [Candidatus Pacearchaeota archaeon]